MKLAVCVKQVPESDDVWIDKSTGTLMRNAVSGILNRADRKAIVMAAELAKDIKKSGEEVTITCITMGPADAKAVLRESIAYGADEGLLLCDPAFAGADTWATSLVLAAAVKKLGGISLIFTGKQSSDGETGHMGPQLAEHLGIPWLTMVRSVKWDKDLKAERVMDGVCEQLSIELPAVISVSEQLKEPETLSVGSICEACEKSVIHWNREDLKLCKELTGLTGSLTEVKRTFLPEQSLKGEMLSGPPGEAAGELVKRLYSRHILHWREEM